MNHRNWLIRLEYRVAVSSNLSSYIYADNGFCEQMRDAPCVTSQQTFYKTYYKLPVSMFTCVTRQPGLIYTINATQYKLISFGEISNMKNIIFSAKFTLINSARRHLS